MNKLNHILTSCILAEVENKNGEQIKALYENLGFDGIYTTDDSYFDYFKSEEYLHTWIDRKIEEDKDEFIETLLDNISEQVRLEYQTRIENFSETELETQQKEIMVKNLNSIKRDLNNSTKMLNQKIDHTMLKVSNRLIDETIELCEVKAYLAILILSGSMLESFLVGLIKNKRNGKLGNKFQNCGSAPKKKDGTVKDFEDWDLINYITVAGKIEPPLFPKADEKMIDYIREARNLVHPNKQFNEDFHAVIEYASNSINAVKIAVKNIQKYPETEF